MSQTKVFELPITKEELAEILRIPVLTLEREIRANKIEYIRIGKNFRFTVEQVEAYINSKVIKASNNY